MVMRGEREVLYSGSDALCISLPSKDLWDHGIGLLALRLAQMIFLGDSRDRIPRQPPFAQRRTTKRGRRLDAGLVPYSYLRQLRSQRVRG